MSNTNPKASTAQEDKHASPIEINTTKPSPQSTSQPPTYTTLQWLLIVLAVYSSAFLYGLDTTIVSVIQGPLTTQFSHVEKIGWLGIGFPLGSCCTIAAWAKAYGVFDTKWCYVGSLVHFAAGSAVCGAAGGMDGLIVGRVWAGAGGAGMYLGQLSIWTQNTTMKTRSMYISGGGAVWGIGCILGPIIGGAFADSPATWRWAFYLNIVLFALFSPIYIFSLHSHDPKPNTPFSQRLAELDWLGIILNAGMYTSFVLSFGIGGTIWPWTSGRTIGCIVAMVIILISFIMQQKLCILTTKHDRLFPLQFIKSRTFVLLFIAQSGIMTALAIPIYYVPLLYQFTHGESAVESALRLLPFVIVNIIIVFVNGALLPRFKYYVPWYIAAGTLITLGGGLLFGLLDHGLSSGAVYGFTVILALGVGLAQQSAYSIVTAKVSPSEFADAIGFINVAQVGSVVVALTFTSLIFQNVGLHQVRQALDGLGFSDEEIRSALGGAKSRVFESEVVSEGVGTSVERGIVEAIRWSFVMVLGAGIVTLGASLGMRWEGLLGGENEISEVHEDVERERKACDGL